VENEAGWGSCKGCQYRQAGGEELVMHRDAWDRVKRVSHPNVIRYELDNARHRGNWVSIKYEFNVCEFDSNPVMQDDVMHRCPWHLKKQRAVLNEKEWWE
jgi:hypothetical protein